MQQPRPALDPQGRFQIQRRGWTTHWFSDSHYRLMASSWPMFLGVLLVGYVSVNALFGFLYWMVPGSVRGAAGYLDHFFFSVQTLATVGYGDMIPVTLYGHSLAALEACLGTLGVGLLAGLTFAKFSIPSARVQFTRQVCLYVKDDLRVLEVRMVNRRPNQLLHVGVSLTLARNFANESGEVERRLFPLKLLTDQTPVFALSFVVTHPLDDASPLRDLSPATAEACNCELILSMSGVDDALSQTVYARRVYTYQDVRWNERFANTLSVTSSGAMELDLAHFDRTIPQPSI